MELIRHGNDINVTWSIFGRNESPYSISGKVYGLWLINGSGKKQITSFSVQARNQLVFLIDNLDLNRLGSFKLELQLREPGAQGATYDLTQVFQIVSETYPRPTATSINGVCDIAFRSVLKNVYVSELEGASAYEIAKQEGYTGTKAQWLKSLVGIQSVYQIASSEVSGGRNTIRFVLSDGTYSDINIFNGGRGASGVTSLRDLSDVSLTEPLSFGELLRYNGSKWTNAGGLDYTYGDGIKISEERVISADIPEIAAGLIAAGYSLTPGGEGASALSGLSDVSLSAPTEGQVLTYDAILGKWVARDATGGSGGSSTLGGLTDVYLPSEITADQVLAYSTDADGFGHAGWKPITLSGGTPLTDYVTLTTAQNNISGKKTFTSLLTASSTLIVGGTETDIANEYSIITSAGAIEVGHGASTSQLSKRRIYFADQYHYIELDGNGNFKFAGGGLYTDSFVSSGLSSGGSGGGGSLPPGTVGQFLKYQTIGGENKWAGANFSLADLGGISTSTGKVIKGSGSSWTVGKLNLSELGDVDFSNDDPQNGQYLKYVIPEGESTGHWVPGTISGSGTASPQSLYFGSEGVRYVKLLNSDNPQRSYNFLTDQNHFHDENSTNKTVKLSILDKTYTLCLSGYSSGGGASVTITPVQLSGTQIATVQIGSGTPFSLYAPTGGGTVPTELPNPNALQFGTNGTQYDGRRTVIVSSNDITNSLGYTPLQSSDISDMATKTWVGSQGFAKTSEVSTALGDYLPLAGGEMEGTIITQHLYPTDGADVTREDGFDLGRSNNFFKDLYIRRIYLYKGQTTAQDVYLEYDEVGGYLKIKGNLVATGFISSGSVSS